MAELDDKLAEAHLLHSQMRDSARRSHDDAGREIVRMRARFAALIVELMQCMKTDARLVANPDKLAAFSSLLSDMRQVHYAHQTRWRGPEIQANPEEYRKSSEALIRNQDEFYAKAMTLLSAA